MQFGLNIKINEGVKCANFEDPRSPDRELTHKKHKTATSGLKIYYFTYNHLACKYEI